MQNPLNIYVSSASAIGDHSQPSATVCTLAHASRTHAAPTARTHGAPKQTRFPFTAKALDALGCKAGRFEVWDTLTPGLGLRVTAEKKSWSFTYTAPGGGRARLPLGTYPATPIASSGTIKGARERAMEARGLVEAGKDPRTVASSAVRPKTMRELCEERLDFEVRGKLRTAAAIEWRYAKYIIPVVGDVAVADFRIEPHYNRCLDPLKRRNKMRMAGMIHTDLMTLMQFAKRRGAIETSRIDAAESVDPKRVRKVWLTPPEIALFWNALPKALVRTKNVQRILRLCLATGQRVGEVAGMSRAELDLRDHVWTIPAERVKNGEKYGAHAVPLSALALSIIREAMAVNSNNSDWLFPNEAGTGPLCSQVIASTLRRAFAAKDFAVKTITPHDLRRTVGTEMLNRANGLRITRHQKYLVLNHQSALKGNVSDEVYDQNDYSDEKREALVKWGTFLADLVGAETGLRVAA